VRRLWIEFRLFTIHKDEHRRRGLSLKKSVAFGIKCYWLKFISSSWNVFEDLKMTELGVDRNDPDLKYLVVDRNSIIDPTLQAEWTSKKLVWIPHDVNGFVAASVKADKGDEFEVEILETCKREYVSKDYIQKMNPPKFNKKQRIWPASRVSTRPLCFTTLKKDTFQD